MRNNKFLEQKIYDTIVNALLLKKKKVTVAYGRVFATITVVKGDAPEFHVQYEVLGEADTLKRRYFKPAQIARAMVYANRSGKL